MSIHWNRAIRIAGLCALLVSMADSSSAKARYVTLASTTSTANSGLFEHILPQFSQRTGIEVRVVAVGTGQALRLARNGDADVLLVHHRPSEEAFVADGFGVRRHGVMYNDFVIVGPKSDPAGIRGCAGAKSAFSEIARKSALFVSRGDDSGTHKRELSLWKTAGVNIDVASGSWYRSTGSGMGATLNLAEAMGAYTLSDRGTWVSFKNKAGLAIQCEGDPSLFNPYGVVLVSKEKFPHIKAEEGQIFIDWLLSAQGQAAIGAFALGGQRLFIPNATP